MEKSLEVSSERDKALPATGTHERTVYETANAQFTITTVILQIEGAN